MDQCSKAALVFENVVASCEIVNSRSVQVSCCSDPFPSPDPRAASLHVCPSLRWPLSGWSRQRVQAWGPKIDESDEPPKRYQRFRDGCENNGWPHCRTEACDLLQ